MKEFHYAEDVISFKQDTIYARTQNVLISAVQTFAAFIFHSCRRSSDAHYLGSGSKKFNLCKSHNVQLT